MKRIVLATVLVATAIGAGLKARPAEAARLMDEGEKVARSARDSVAANPVPTALALGTFVLTVVYHKIKGKSLRESLEVAATRVTVVAAPVAGETPVVARARARATRTQLMTDQIGLLNRLKGLPDAVKKAEKDASYTEQAVADAERALAAKTEAHDEAVTKLDALRAEKVAGYAELAAIDAELKKLAEVV